MREVKTARKAAAIRNQGPVRSSTEKRVLALEQDSAPAATETKRILRARAELLAREPEAEKNVASIEVVEFLLSYEKYDIESSYVREVYPLKEFTPLPGTPPYVLGLINIRGQILSVIDIRKFFELPEKGLTNLNRVIIIRNEAMEFGILADSVLGTRNITVDEIQPPPPTFTGILEKYLKGVADGQVSILDAQKLLEDRGLIVNREVGQGGT